MNLVSYIILAIIAVLAYLAIKTRNKTDCCGSSKCANCTNCPFSNGTCNCKK